MRLLVFTLIFLYSCSQNITADSEITFTVPEGHFAAPVSGIKMKATLALKAYYSFSGIGSSGNMAAVFIITDSLKTMTYRTVQGDGSMFSLNNISYSYINTGDYIDVTITGYSNGFVNGTFTGTISKAVSINPLVVQSVTITGVIKNAKLTYL